MDQNKEKRPTLSLIELKEESDLSAEHLQKFSTFFTIPPFDHSLKGQLDKINNICKLLSGLDISKPPKLKEVTDYLITHKNDPKVRSIILSKQAGEKSGLASTYPLYDALQKIPKFSSHANIFELLTGLAFAIKHIRPSIKLTPNPALKSNLINISRVIRNQSKPSYINYVELTDIKIEDFEKETLLNALNKYKEITGASLIPALKTLIEHFASLKEETPQNSVTDSRSKTKIVRSKTLLKEIKKSSKNKKSQESDQLVVTIYPINDPKKVNLTGSILDDSLDSDSLVVDEFIEDNPKSPTGNRVAAKAVQQKGIMQSQFSRYRWERLSNFEKNIIISEAKRKNGLGETCALITLALGSEPLDWGKVELKTTMAHQPCLNLESGVLKHKIHVHPNSWQPSPEQERYLNNTNETLPLKLPEIIRERLLNQTYNGQNTLAQLFGSTPEALQNELTQWLLKLPYRNRELTPAKLREELYSTIMDQTMDEVAAHMIALQPTFILPVQSFYTALTQEKLSHIYNNAISEIFGEIQENPVEIKDLTGSKLQVKNNYLITIIHNLKYKLESTSTRDIVEYHNVFTLYTFHLLSFASGHRLVTDPFAKKHDFIENFKSVVIYDKETDLNHTGRLSVLGSIAWQQYLNYCEHLQNLANLIYEKNKLLRSRILNCLEGQESLPFLFFLKEDSQHQLDIVNISTKSLSFYHPNWTLPFNLNRHYLSSNLRAYGANAELIDYHLGHFQNGSQGLGISSSLSMNQIASHLSPLIDSLISNIGFLSITSKLRSKAVGSKKFKTSKKELGYIQREQKRKSKKLKSHSLIKQEVKELETKLLEIQSNNKKEDFKEKSQELIEKSLTRLINNKDVAYKAKSIKLFNNLLLRISRKYKMELKLEYSISCITSDPSPITPKTGSNYQQFQALRNIFSKNLPAILKSENQHDVQNLAAYLLLIEIFFGRLHNLLWIKGFFEFLSNKPSIKGGNVTLIIPLSEDKQSNFRYTCSSIGTLFLLSKLEIFQNSILLEQNTILEIADILLKDILGNKVNLKELLKLAQTADTLELPGALRAACGGQIRTFSINHNRYQSIQNQTPVFIERPNDLKNERQLNSETRVYRNASFSYKSTKKAQKTIRNFTNEANHQGHKKHLKCRLEKEIKNTLRNESIFPIYAYLLEWGLSLLSLNPENRKKRAKGINKQIHTNSNGLIETFRDIDPISLSENEFMEAYNQVISYYPSFEKETEQVIRHIVDLKRFHNFLVESFGAPEIDFEDLDIPESLSGYLVSANIINFDEYRLILTLLKNDPFANEWQKQYQSLVFCLCFNFGLRSNEVFNLSIKDIQFATEQTFLGNITIQPNKYGILKTSSSKRNLPLNLWLDEDEQKLLKSFVKTRLDQGATSDSPLFGYYDSAYVSESLKIKNRIIEAMRLVTGDQTLKLHHLRHSFATWMFTALTYSPSELFKSDDLKINKVQNHFNFSNSRRALFQLAELMGHSHPSTTIINYIHGYDYWLKEYKNAFGIDVNNYKLLSAITNTKEATLRKWKQRNEENSPLISICINRFLPSSDYQEIEKKDYINTLPKNNDSCSEPKFNFEQLNWLVKRYADINGLKNFSNALYCEPDDAEALIKAFTEVSKISGFLPETMIRLFQASQFDIDKRLLQKIPRQDIDNVWVKKFENLLTNNTELSEHISKILHTWLQYVHPNETFWKFETTTQIEDFIQGLTYTGILKKRFLLRGYEEQIKIKSLCDIDYRTIPDNQKSRMARSHIAINLDNENLELMVLNERKSSVVRSMNYFLFLASVYMLFIQNRE